MLKDRLARAAAAAALFWALPACSVPNLASSLDKPPEFAPAGQARCGVQKSQTRPLIVEWPSPDRLALETQARKGLIAVRYQGCEMEVLRRCRVPGRYAYTPATRQDDRITIRDEDELYATIPVYAAKFQGKLHKAGQLNVTMAMVGTFDSDRAGARLDELDGDCSGATHFVSSLTVGAFEFFAGSDVAVEAGGSVAGAGAQGRSAADRETLNRAGDEKACASTRTTTRPRSGVGRCSGSRWSPSRRRTRRPRPLPPAPVAVAPPSSAPQPAPAASAPPKPAPAPPSPAPSSAAQPAAPRVGGPPPLPALPLPKLGAFPPAARAAARLLYTEGNALLTAGQHAEALEKFRRAFATIPSAAAMLKMGLCYEGLGQRDLAAQSFREVLQMEPSGALADQATAHLASPGP